MCLYSHGNSSCTGHCVLKVKELPAVILELSREVASNSLTGWKLPLRCKQSVQTGSLLVSINLSKYNASHTQHGSSCNLSCTNLATSPPLPAWMVMSVCSKATHGKQSRSSKLALNHVSLECQLYVTCEPVEQQLQLTMSLGGIQFSSSLNF